MSMNIAIITACPSGVATSVVAADLLAQAASKLGLKAKIECQSRFVDAALTDADIEQASIIVIAANTAVDTARFVGKKVYQADIQQAVLNPSAFLEKAQAEARELTQADVAQAASSNPALSSSSVQKIVAITACPTGVAHTFMAAEALETESKRRGHQIKVETRGSVGAKNQLTEQEIADADLVIIAADIEVPLDRFNGKKMYRTKTSPALKKTAEELDKAFSEATVYTHSGASAAATEEKKGIYKHLMTGVSHMLPVVVAGGLIIALSFVFGIEAFKEEGTLAAALMNIGGGAALALMIPVLAGYIAFSIADRPGLTPGLVGGMLASSTGAGFLGGIAAGFIAGYAAKFLADKVTLPQSMEALKPILIIPFVATLFTGLAMVYVVGGPVAGIMTGLTNFLNNMGSESAVLLGIVLGAMMCFDLGGPINKAAYAFGVGLLASQSYAPMAAIMAAGMVPPLGMGLATFIAKKKFDASEREAGKAAFVLGLCFISEGAIPFAAKDPMRVIPASIAGGALTGALSMLSSVELMAPHGGLFVLLIPNAISPVLLYLVAIAAGTLVTGFSYAYLKTRSEDQQLTAA